MENLKPINIIYEDNHLLVVLKPINIPVQEDESKDKDLLSILKTYLKEKYQKKGNVYLGLVHRLDRPVSGIMVFAKTSKCASRLSLQIKNKEVIKFYYAIVEGKILKNGILIDKLYKDTKNNIVYISEKGKDSKLEYEVIKCVNNLTLVKINLVTGRSHQIRVQFSSRNFPLYGDQKYNKKAVKGAQIALFAYHLSFNHPITKEKMVFELEKPTSFPWNLF
jgi:23S rRNA pseudouridine1911/1915/1917 synthase